MYIVKIALFLMMLASFSACQKQDNNKMKACSAKEQCLNDPDCYCWCSQSCGWRKKTASDRPVYIENDPYGKHCYCKQWDFDHYEDNCIHGKNIQQPPGSR